MPFIGGFGTRAEALRINTSWLMALRPIFHELHAIRDDLEDLRHRVRDMAGYRKEIDYAFERIAAIEKHLGIDRKQVA